MRRRQKLTTAGLPVPPPELRTCYVEDWVRPDEEQPSWSLPDSWADWATLAARRRWSRARADWLDTNRIPRSRWCELLPTRSPRWRHERRGQSAPF